MCVSPWLRWAAREMGFEFDFQGAQVVANDPFIDGGRKRRDALTFALVGNKALANKQASAKSSS